MRCNGASFCVFCLFALSFPLLCAHIPGPLQGPCTSGRAEQHCGTQATWAWRHSSAKVSWLWPGMLQIRRSISWKQTTKMLTLLFSSPLTVLSYWSIAEMTHCDPSAASLGILHMGAQLTVNVSTPLMSSPKSYNNQGVWQFPDMPMLRQSISFTTFLPQYSGVLVSRSTGIWWSNDQWGLKFGNSAPTT